MSLNERISRKVKRLLHLDHLAESWKSEKMPAEQWKLVEQQLAQLRAGAPVEVFEVAAHALKAIPGDEPLSLLEVGCASGYYSEVIPALVGTRFQYAGGDYSDAMLAFAREKYPTTKFVRLDTRAIDLADRSYDVVLSGAVLVHVKEWEKSIGELARVSRSFLVLHRTPTTIRETWNEERASYAGVPVRFNRFNRADLLSTVEQCGFSKIFEEEVYPHQDGDPIEVTFVFERL